MVDNAGLRPYQLASKFRAKFGGTRHTANRYLARAREQLAENHGSALRDLASSLPGKFASALERARDGGNARVEARLLSSLLQLAGNAKRDEPGEPINTIELVVVESPGNNDGKAKTNK